MLAGGHGLIVEEGFDVAGAGDGVRAVHSPAGRFKAAGDDGVARSADVELELAGGVGGRGRAVGGEERPGRRVGGAFERSVPGVHLRGDGEGVVAGEREVGLGSQRRRMVVGDANRRVAGEQAARAGEHVEIPILLRLRAGGDAPGRAGAVFIQRDARAVFEHGLVAASE